MKINQLAAALAFFGLPFSAPIFCQNSDSTASSGALGTVILNLKNEKNVNSDQLEFSPTFYEDGIVFSSTNPAGLKKEKDEKLRRPAISILRSKRGDDGELAKPEPFAQELSTRFHEGPVSFDRTAETIFFSRSILKRGEQKRDKKGVNRMTIYFSKIENGKWSKPTELNFNPKAEWDDVHPTLSIDGDKLFFASNRPGGFGGMDLYVSFLINENWSEPINLGASVNSDKNEVFPFIHADHTLYFASTGHGSTGGLDLFYTQPDAAEWLKPINLGEPFNTPGDDFGLIVDLDKMNGYYASNGQKKGAGGDDILSFATENGNLDEYFLQKGKALPRDLDVLATVFDKNGQPIEGASVRIVPLAQANVIGQDSLGRPITVTTENGQDILKVGEATPADAIGTTDAAGRFSTVVQPGNYALIFSKNGYESRQVVKRFAEPGNELIVTLEPADGKIHLVSQLLNPLTGQPIAGATIVLTDKATGKTDTLFSDASGRVDGHLLGGKSYAVDVFQNGKNIGKTAISTQNFRPGESGELKMTLEIEATPFAAGNVIRLPNIYYNYNDAMIRPAAKRDLDGVLAILKANPAFVFELGAHTDARGSSEYNQKLSDRRAESAAGYLRKKGVEKDRLQAVGYGESQPINECADGSRCPEERHAANRRTEIKVVAGLQPGQTVISGVSETRSASNDVLEAIAELDRPGTAEPKKPVKTTKVNEKPAKSEPKPEKVKPEKGVSYGKPMDYFVLTGSFLMESRAKNRLRQLEDLGFKKASIEQFQDYPDFYCVVALKSNSFEEANAYAQQLTSKHSIKTYVKTVARK